MHLINGTESTLFLSGNMFLMEENNLTYEIPYNQATKFSIIVANILEKHQTEKGEVSIDGTIISSSDKSCQIKTKDNVTYNIDLRNTKIVDSTGKGNLLIHEKDIATFFYTKATAPSNNGPINASMAFIKSASR
jgi:hypothetical protein